MLPTRSLGLALVLAAAACSPEATPLTPAGEALPRQAAAAALPPPACLDFNVPALGTPYGAAWGTPVGVPQWVENGITAAVVPYNPGPFFAEARVVMPPVPFGAGPTGRARSINWQFDFTGLPFIPSMVTFEWLDQGTPSPVENLAVNGSPLWIGQLHAPPAAFGPIGVVSGFAAAPGGLTGSIRLMGPVQRVVVGGQPVWIDRVCAHP
jgi:hypothetical protein